MNNTKSSVIVLMYVLIVLATRVLSDDGLINRMCDKTDVPVECKDCIMGSGYAPSITKDFHVPQIMLYCADNGAKNLSSITKNLLAASSTSGPLKTALDRCDRDIAEIPISDNDIRFQIANKAIGNARDMLSNLVFQRFQFCANAFKTSGVDMPPPMFSKYLFVTTDFQLTDQLLSFVKV